MSMTGSNMTGKTVLVTGGTGGIGKHTAIGLAKQGARVIVSGRNRERGLEGVAEIQRASGNQNVHLLLADLSTMAGVRQLAASFKAQFDRLDVLVNNAGLLEGQRRETSDGLEAHFAVNVIAPYLLTLELLPLLHTSRGRVVNLNGGMPFGQIDLGNMQAEKSFEGLRSYSHTKMLMSAMSLEFARRLSGTGVTVTALCPGPVESGFQARAAMEDSKLVKGGNLMTSAEVAKQAVEALGRGQRVVIPGLMNQIQALLPKFLPRGMVPGIVKSAQARSH